MYLFGLRLKPIFWIISIYIQWWDITCNLSVKWYKWCHLISKSCQIIYYNLMSFDVKNVIVNDSLWQSVNGGDKATKNSDERRVQLKNKQGKPRQKWINNVLETVNLTKEDATTLAQESRTLCRSSVYEGVNVQKCIMYKNV